jgi:hypothetical protein
MAWDERVMLPKKCGTVVWRESDRQREIRSGAQAMKTAQELWNSYKELLSAREYKAWRALWVENGRFTIAYDRMPPDTNYASRQFEKEVHVNRDVNENDEPDMASLFNFFSSSDSKILDTKFDDKGVYQTKDNNIFFVVSTITIKTIDGLEFRNYLSLKVTTIAVNNERKFTEIVEFCDPIAREALFQHLADMF